jgi:hypothetical protein
VFSLNAAHLEHWAAHRYAVVREALAPSERTTLRNAAAELQAWPETPGRWMKYFEPGPERLLCRVENFAPYHGWLGALLCRDDMLAALKQLLGEPALLFKEKINYKLPGGEGFAPHQDAPAFTSFDQTYHITVMLSIDATTVENGCLELVDGYNDGVTLPQSEDGTLAPSTASGLDWKVLETDVGDVVFFDSYVPHRSAVNRSHAPRRALYVTYNRASEGDRRADYYALKRSAFPPECERDPNAPPHPASGIFNLGNPIR